MAKNFISMILVGQGCTGGSGAEISGSPGGSFGDVGGGITISDGLILPQVIENCGAGIYWQNWETVNPIPCQGSDGDLAVMRVPFITIDGSQADWMYDVVIHAILTESGDAGYALDDMIPIHMGRFNGVKCGSNSDAFHWMLRNDKNREEVDVIFNYQGGAGEDLENVIMNPETAAFDDMDIEKWKIRITIMAFWAG